MRNLKSALAILVGVSMVSITVKAVAQDVGSAPEFPSSTDECTAWGSEARKIISDKHARRWRASTTGDSYGRINLQEMNAASSDYKEESKYVSAMVTDCIARARSSQSVREDFRNLIPSHERNSSSYNAWSRISPYAAEGGVAINRAVGIVDKARQIYAGISNAREFLRSPSAFLSNQITRNFQYSVEVAYSRAGLANERLANGPFFNQFNAQNLGRLQSFHNNAFNDLDRSIKNISEFNIQQEIYVKTQRFTQQRLLYVASYNEQIAVDRLSIPVLSASFPALAEQIRQLSAARVQEAAVLRQAAAAERLRLQEAQEAAQRQIALEARQKRERDLQASQAALNAQEAARQAEARRQAADEAASRAQARAEAAADAARAQRDAAALGEALGGLIGSMGRSGSARVPAPSPRPSQSWDGVVCGRFACR